MVERVEEVVPVEVGVDAEHLEEDGAADVAKVFGKAAALADPVLAAGLVAVGGFLGGRGVGDALVVGGEDHVVVDLSGDPTLHEGDVLVGRQLNRLMAAVEPGVGMVALQVSIGHIIDVCADLLCGAKTYLPADILGQVERLQMEVPSLSFSTMTRTKFHSTR